MFLRKTKNTKIDACGTRNHHWQKLHRYFCSAVSFFPAITTTQNSTSKNATSLDRLEAEQFLFLGKPLTDLLQQGLSLQEMTLSISVCLKYTLPKYNGFPKLNEHPHCITPPLSTPRNHHLASLLTTDARALLGSANYERFDDPMIWSETLGKMRTCCNVWTTQSDMWGQGKLFVEDTKCAFFCKKTTEPKLRSPTTTARAKTMPRKSLRDRALPVQRCHVFNMNVVSKRSAGPGRENGPCFSIQLQLNCERVESELNITNFKKRMCSEAEPGGMWADLGQRHDGTSHAKLRVCNSAKFDGNFSGAEWLRIQIQNKIVEHMFGTILRKQNMISSW